MMKLGPIRTVSLLMLLLGIHSISVKQIFAQASSAPQVSNTETRRSASDVTLIPIEEGGVNCNELFDALSSEIHWVAGSITAFTRGMGINTENSQRLPVEAVDNLVQRFPDIFSYRDSPEGEHRYLAVDVDALASFLGDRKSRLRRYLATIQDTELASLRKVASTWREELKAPPRILVIMSGLHSLASSAEAVAVELNRRTNLPAYVFSYPNDGPISESAGMLVLSLQDLHREYPQSRITLITHSMGGLVSRAALEMPGQASAGGKRLSTDITALTGIDQLIQVCPPNHGSALAEYGGLLEPAEQVYRLVTRNRNRESVQLFRSIVDGFNEASADLAPGSKFLAELNRCPRNPQVRYSILAGNAGPLGETMTTLLGTIWERVADSVLEPQALDRRIEAVLTCDELQRGKGDGVVAVESTKLTGVTDREILDMHHLVWDRLETKAGQAMLDAVAKRLGIRL